ncbi:hypothetical protein HW555_000938 [Spodoptera exigua]|uniref:G-protein coupled receptors family 2 profile 2 domain-containing protein n=1 Tax=Spodoptera exigua TaxID=7107 RepID=A0A835L9C7_SPOEX|nr:hypothetical protein HW555_000938 [Spodoptera exigua]
MWALLTLFTVIGRVVTQSEPCDYNSSVKLDNRTYNGIVFNEEELFYDNITNTERGCICMKKICVRKCCDPGFIYNATHKVYTCQQEKQNEEFNQHLIVHEGFNVISKDKFDPMKKFHFIYGRMDCTQFNNSVRIGLKKKNLPRLLTALSRNEMQTIIVFIVFAIITQIVSQCDEEYSVVLKNRTYKGVKYERNEIIVDNVTKVERGCVCLKEVCAKKCCPLGQAYHRQQKICIDITEPFYPPVYREYKLLPGYNATKELHFFYGKMNCSDELEEVRVPVAPASYDFHLRTVRIITYCRLMISWYFYAGILPIDTLINGAYFGRKLNENETFITKNGEKRGCVCLNGRKCIRKCCHFGMAYNFKMKKCVDLPTGKYSNPLVTFEDESIRDNYVILTGKMTCSKRKNELRLRDGKLYVKIETSVKALVYDASKYCIDTFVSDTEGPHLNALICFVSNPERNNYTMSTVYAWLPELRNLHGMVLMAYLLSFFVGFLFLATMQILILLKEISEDICIVLTFIVYFSLLSAFFWLNVMCYDIWWTFSGKRAHGRSGSQNKRFLCYAIYAFGVPTILTIVLAALEFSNIPLHPLLPKLRLQGCFLYGNSKLLYLYGPIVILCVANLIFFTLTAFKIAKIKRETKMLRDKESSTHDQDRKDTQRFTLYVKLFTVMGINWILEVVSSFYPEADVFWQFSDAYNVLVGLIIFIIFVCKKKTWRMIKKRIKDYQRFKSNKKRRDSREVNINNRQLTQWRTQPDRTSSLETIKTTDGETSLRSNKSISTNPH